jgi:PAS domain-containing protein
VDSSPKHQPGQLLARAAHRSRRPTQVKRAIEHAIATKTVFELEHRVRRPDGTLGWALSRAVPVLDENDEIIEWVGAASDITTVAGPRVG